MKKILALIALIILLAIGEQLLKKQDGITIEEYKGDDIQLMAIIDTMPSADSSENQNNKNSGNYGEIEISSQFLMQNDILKIEYMVDKDVYKESNLKTLEKNKIRIDNIYCNEKGEATVKILIKNKENNKEKILKLTSTAEVVW